MNTCKIYRKKMLDAFYQHLTAQAQDEFNRHLSGCTSCTTEYAELEKSLSLMNQRVRPEPDEGFEERLWQNVRSGIETQDRRLGVATVSEKIIEIFKNRNLRYSLALAASMLIIGIFIGKYMDRETSNDQIVKTVVHSENSAFVRAGKYVDRSKVLLLGILNHDPMDRMGLESQKRISQNMVREAAILKNELKDSQDRVLAHLIGELEVILLQIASLEADYDLESVELIQSGIEHKGLLFKINLNQALSETGKEVTSEKQNKIGI